MAVKHQTTGEKAERAQQGGSDRAERRGLAGASGDRERARHALKGFLVNLRLCGVDASPREETAASETQVASVLPQCITSYLLSY